MNIKSIITLAAALMLGTAAIAQEQKGPIDPVRVSVALTAGANTHLSVTAPSGMLTSYENQAFSVDWTDKALAFGVEGSLIICDRWKLDLGGSLSNWNNPPYAAILGTMGEEYSTGDIPTYKAVNMQHKVNYQAYIAGSYYFRVKSTPNLRPYAGVRFIGSYAGATMRSQDFNALGRSAAEAYTLCAGILTGVDYYFSRNFFVGMSVEPFRWTYGANLIRPQEGLLNLGADVYYYAAFAAPQLKIGFLF